MPADLPRTLENLKQRYYAKQTMIERLKKEQLEIIEQVYELASSLNKDQNHEKGLKIPE